jgi:hypothetical protein
MGSASSFQAAEKRARRARDEIAPSYPLDGVERDE